MLLCLGWFVVLIRVCRCCIWIMLGFNGFVIVLVDMWLLLNDCGYVLVV